MARFQCPHCNTVLEINATEGVVVSCGQCGGQFTAGPTATVVATPVESQFDFVPRESSSPSTQRLETLAVRQRRKKRTNVWLVGGLLLMVSVLIMALVYVALNDGDFPIGEKTNTAKLISCTDCGKKISRAAIRCPNCGAPNELLVQFEAARMQLSALETIIKLYYLDMGVYPNSLSELRVAPRDSENVESWKWNGPYSDKDLPPDPWGNAWLYKVTRAGDSYQLGSAGPDSLRGTKDDIFLEVDD